MDNQECTFDTGNNGLNRVIARLKQGEKFPPSIIERAISGEQPVFIFIPGILGSTLKTESGEVIWGAYPSEQTRLEYNKAQKIITEPLDHFKIHWFKTDVYGVFFKILEDLNVGSVRHFLYFSYDWRQDNRLSADEFDQRIRRNDWANILKDRKVVIVAHSMGGLVSKYWHGKFYSRKDKNYPFKVIGTIHLGVPHQGALSSLVTLIEGYATANATPWFFRSFADSTIFNKLNDYGHTFPSIYQLLPSYRHNLVYFITNTKKTHDIDIFDIANWIKFDWLEKARGVNPKESFYKRIEPLLNDGIKFQHEILNMKPIPKAVYFYSSNHKTIEKLTIREVKKYKYEIDFKLSKESGDGRVVRKVAMNFKEIKDENEARPLNETHGNLPKDHLFIDYIDNIRELAIRNSRSKIAQATTLYPGILDAFEKERVLLEVPLDTKSWRYDLFSKIMDTNKAIISGFSKKHGVKPGDLAYRAAENSSDPSIKKNLYALSIAFDDLSESTKYRALNKLGTLLYERNYLTAAKQFLNRAVKINPENLNLDSVQFLRTQELAHNHLYEIYKQLGNDWSANKSLAKVDHYNNLLMGGAHKIF